jgi:ADP-heptose:LPS heptosyltransferase
VGRRDGTTHLLQETFDRLGWGDRPHDRRCRVHLTPEERARGRERLGATARPILTFSTLSKEVVKNWPADFWRAALAALREKFHLVQLGDASEPEFEGVQRFAGRLSLRESMSVLSHARVHVGADSFLMHAANGLDVRAVIILGGSRTAANVGYAENVNLASAVPCSPCWIHTSRGERCEHALVCLTAITPAAVLAAIERQVARETIVG